MGGLWVCLNGLVHIQIETHLRATTTMKSRPIHEAERVNNPAHALLSRVLWIVTVGAAAIATWTTVTAPSREHTRAPVRHVFSGKKVSLNGSPHGAGVDGERPADGAVQAVTSVLTATPAATGRVAATSSVHGSVSSAKASSIAEPQAQHAPLDRAANRNTHRGAASDTTMIASVATTPVVGPTSVSARSNEVHRMALTAEDDDEDARLLTESSRIE